MGSGTTLVEAKLLGRNAIGIDVNQQAIAITKNNLDFSCTSSSRIILRNASATNLNFIKDASIDLICTHPPYADAIKYSEDIEEDISLLQEQDFLEQMSYVATEAYRVLKSGKNCVIMMGDIRCHGKVVPLGFKVMQCFLDAGFLSKEIIIKEQHNCLSTDYWSKRNNNFLLLAHEYILVFEK